jgi:signal transduction histidine kinase/ligand-binding sensor domain-containing protein
MLQCRRHAREIVVLATAAVLWLAGAIASGAAAESNLPPYVVRTWSTDDGLPQNAVTAVLQSKDGYIWAGTYSGLARFDGVHFTIFNSGNTPALRSGRVTSLFEDAAGTLWIGSEIGELTACYPGPRFQSIDIERVWGRRRIIAVVSDREGDLWLADVDGTIMRLKDRLRLRPPSGHAANLAGVCTDRQNDIWVLRNGMASALEQDRLIPQFGGDVSPPYVQGVCGSREGGVWVASWGTLRRENADRTTNDFGVAPWGDSPPTTMLETAGGLLAVGTQDRGLFVVRPGGAVLNLCRTNGLVTDWISTVCEDREGNLWIGSGGNGLVMVRPGNVTTLDPPDHWQGRPVLCLTSGRDGALWVGTEGAGLYRWQGDQWTRFGLEAGVGNLFIWSVCEDAGGRLWVGTWGGGLLTRMGERFEAVPVAFSGVPSVTALFNSGAGQIWAGTSTGLLRYDSGKPTWLTYSGPTPISDVRCVFQDRQGTVWFGMLGGGLGRLDKDGMRLLRKSDGLTSDFIQFLHPDSDGSLWIGTFGGGLNRLKDGHFSAISKAQGLSDDILCWMEDDGLGYFWLSSHSGIMRLSKRELGQCADGLLKAVNCLTFGKGDGLPTLEFSGGLQPAGYKTADGRLWFASNKGLVVVSPKDVKLNSLAPPVVIEAMQVDGRAMARPPEQTAANPLRIPPGRHRLEFIYTGLSYVASEKVRFRYRLEGLDSEWTDAGTHRSANFDYVPPGSYVFHVIACNDAGVWNEVGATVAFVLLPFFWQTWWFAAVAGTGVLAAVAAGVWLGARRRLRRRVEALERIQAIESERARIARDIHDELGSNLTRITMLSEPARQSAAGKGGKQGQIYEIARELTRTMDEIVWAVNPAHDTLEGLVNYLVKFAQDFLAAGDIRCRLDLPLNLPPWPLTAETRHNLFLALKEALNNCLKHSHASEVRLILEMEPDAFILSVADNGRGFDPGQIDAALAGADRFAPGNGLANMRQRLGKINGRFEIRSSPGRGTTVVFSVPIPPTPVSNGHKAAGAVS